MLPVAVLAGVPVTPDRDTARQWLVQELSKPEYATQPSLLERLWLWFVHLFDAIPGVSAPPWQVLLGVLVVAAVVVVVARTVAGPVRLARARAARPVSAADDARTAAQLRSAADAAADRRDWPLAVAERFRAVVRGLEERVVIDESPGRTAQEAATAAGTRLPAAAQALHAGAVLFDDVVYGERDATPADDARLRDLDAQVGGLRATVGP